MAVPIVRRGVILRLKHYMKLIRKNIQRGIVCINDGGININKLTFGLFIFTGVFLLVVGCSSQENYEEKYYVLIVEGSENISGELGRFVGKEYSIYEMEYLTSLERANEKYPRYGIEKAPAILIFKTFGEMKQLKLKTYEVDEAIDFLERKKGN